MKKKIVATISTISLSVVLVFGLFATLIANPKTKKTINDNSFVERYDYVYYASAAEDTGASTASSFYKGGSVYLAPNSTYTIKNGLIESGENRYGGAIYVSSGSVVTMQGGTIQNCSAKYGGAVYVEKGGTFIMKGGTITNCKANVGPAIYVEEGGTLQMESTSTLKKNYVYVADYAISEDTIMVGHITNGKRMHYMEYGSYPQTYVGNTMNSTLESWFVSSSPSVKKTYTTTANGLEGIWKSYLYTDGNYYVRGVNFYNTPPSGITTDMKYSNGQNYLAYGAAIWFKVEPIQWVVLNYDDVMNGTASEILVLSYLGISSYVTFNPTSVTNRNVWSGSNLRTWLNGEFFNTAFTAAEQKSLNLKTIKNNVTGNFSSATSDGTGTSTQDRLWCLSNYEANAIYFITQGQKLLSPTDFAIGNYCMKNSDSSLCTATYPNGGTCEWWTRSAGSQSYYALIIYTGGGSNSDYTHITYRAVRPVMSLSIT